VLEHVPLRLVDTRHFIETRRPEWDRLRDLTERARQLEPREVDELIDRYHAASSDLSAARTHHRDRQLINALTTLVGAANGVIYGTKSSARRAFVGFFAVVFPAAVWAHRWRIALAAALFVLPALVFGVWISNSDAALEATADETTRAAYVEVDFEEYYSSEPAEQFSTEVFINNVRVAFLAFALGITLGLGTAAVLLANGAFLGLAAGLFHASDAAPQFWGLIMPHGLLEISAIVVAGGAGFALGWAVVSPGDQTRFAALAEEGQRSAAIVLGLIPVFGVAALIEGFVTPSPLSTPIRVAIGVIAFAAFWTWTLLWGRNAAAAGATGRFTDVLAPT